MGTIYYTGAPGEEPEVIPVTPRARLVTEGDLERFARAHDGPVIIDGKTVRSKNLLSIVAELQEDELRLLPADTAEQILANIRRQKAQALLQRDLDLKELILEDLEMLSDALQYEYCNGPPKLIGLLARMLGLTYEQVERERERQRRFLNGFVD